MPSPLIIPPDQAPAPLEVVGEEITVLAPGSRTGSYEIFRQAGPEGAGPPLHSHPWDESFYVMSGTVIFDVDGDCGVAAAGTLVHVPAGVPHHFQFGAGGGEMLSMTSLGEASELFVDLDRGISHDHPDFEKLVDISVRHGLEILATPDHVRG